MRNTKGAIAFTIALAFVLTSCASSPSQSDSKTLKVVAAFYPIAFVASEVGGSLIEVENITPPGVEPHDLELSPSQITRLDKADLLIYIAGFQPALEKAAEQSPPRNTLDVLTIENLKVIDQAVDGHSHDLASSDKLGGASDPHIWLDPQRLITLVNKIATIFSSLDPENATSYESASILLIERITELDDQFATGLKTCERRLIVTSHAAFGYLADAYGLEQEPITGLSPESEPTPKRLNEIRKLAKANGTTTIFFESLASPKVAQSLADDLKIKAEVLDPLEGVKGNDSYFTVMDRNLEALRKALKCS